MINRRFKHTPDECTACTICTAYCPVAKVTKRFRGPKMTGPAFERFRLLNQADDDGLSYCSNCKNCDISCPSGVPVSTFNMLARAEYVKIPGNVNRVERCRDWLIAHGEALDWATKLIPSAIRNIGMNNPISRRLLDIVGIDKRSPLPNFASKGFRKLSKKLDNSLDNDNDKVIALFPGCFINVYSPKIGVDLFELLKGAGYKVHVPEEFICCGLPLISNGFAAEAERNAMQNIQELYKWAKRGIKVLVACPSCALMLKEEYADLYPMAHGLIQAKQRKLGSPLAETVVDACEFMLNLMSSGEYTPEIKGDRLSVAYHAPCHLKAQGMGRTGYELLSYVGLHVHDVDSGCCGISGSYGFKKEKYKVSMDIGKKLFEEVMSSNADVVASECGTCQVQISHGTGKKVFHPISILNELIKGNN